MESLNTDIYSEIFGCLSLSDSAHVAAVSKAMRDAVYHPAHWTRVIPRISHHHMSDEHLATSLKTRGISAVEWHTVPDSEQPLHNALENCSKLAEIKTMFVPQCTFTQLITRRTEFPVQLTSLRCLVLYQCGHISDFLINQKESNLERALAPFVNLEQFHLHNVITSRNYGDNLTDELLTVVVRCLPNLKDLEVKSIHRVDGYTESIAYMFFPKTFILPELERLCLSTVSILTMMRPVEQLPYLFPKLKHIDVETVGRWDLDGIDQMEDLPFLESVRLSGPIINHMEEKCIDLFICAPELLALDLSCYGQINTQRYPLGEHTRPDLICMITAAAPNLVVLDRSGYKEESLTDLEELTQLTQLEILILDRFGIRSYSGKSFMYNIKPHLTNLRSLIGVDCQSDVDANNSIEFITAPKLDDDNKPMILRKCVDYGHCAEARLADSTVRLRWVPVRKDSASWDKAFGVKYFYPATSYPEKNIDNFIASKDRQDS